MCKEVKTLKYLENNSKTFKRNMENIRLKLYDYIQECDNIFYAAADGRETYEEHKEKLDSIKNEIKYSLENAKQMIKLLLDFEVITYLDAYGFENEDEEEECDEIRGMDKELYNIKKKISYPNSKEYLSEHIQIVRRDIVKVLGEDKARDFFYDHESDKYHDFLDACSEIIKDIPLKEMEWFKNI